MRLLGSVLLASVLIAQQKPAAMGTLSGVVIDAATGVPLNKVHILAEPVSGPGRIASTSTDAKGGFTLLNIAPGQYRLRGQRNGYVDTYYGARRAEGKGIPISLEAGQEISRLEFKLFPVGVIAGAVRESDGEPLLGAAVTVYRLKFESGQRRLSRVENAQTDDLGQYRIPNLLPGRYYIRAEARKPVTIDVDDHTPKSDNQREILVPGLYQGGQDQGSARAVEVIAGARLIGIDITLTRTNAVPVRGHAAAPSGTRLGGISLSYGNTSSDLLGLRLETRADAKGNFVFQAVPPGSYTLTAVAKLPAKSTNQLLDLLSNQAELKAHVRVDVGRTAVDGIRVVVEDGVQVSGSVRVQGSDNARLGRGFIVFDDGRTESIDARINSEGKFTVVLSRGHYQVYPHFSDVIVQSIRLHEKNILEEGLMISEHTSVPLEVVVTPDGGQAAGLVVDKNNQSVAGATAVLIPESRLRFRADLFRRCETDQNGRYAIKMVPPGEYKLFAWDDIEDGVWHDPDFLKVYESRGKSITVQPKATKTADLYLITAGNQQP